ncbi:MAG: 5-formyltetrahydrofolate cyclo-ligase [Isosphaeraceae bacterium]
MQRDQLKRQLKRSLRRSIVSAVMSLDPPERQRQESLLIERFPELPGFRDASTVLLYVKAFPEELDTLVLLRGALLSGKSVVCPRVDPQERRLRLYRIDSLEGDLGPGILGIPEPHPNCPEMEPRHVDWALVPGLAFDTRCDRLGRGGGHYDRLLPRLRPDAPRWALGFDCQLVPELPVERHDVPVDGVATASRLLARA